MSQYKNQLEDRIKEKIILVLTALFPHEKIYLFGSRATGKNQEMSDIDIAIDGSKKMPIQDIDEAKAVMESLNIPYKVDIVDFYSISPSMQEEIEKHRIVWKA